jgi:hypothetical protein
MPDERESSLADHARFPARLAENGLVRGQGKQGGSNQRRYTDGNANIGRHADREEHGVAKKEGVRDPGDQKNGKENQLSDIGKGMLAGQPVPVRSLCVHSADLLSCFLFHNDDLGANLVFFLTKKSIILYNEYTN